MKTYFVYVKESTYRRYNIEAESAQEAQEIAEASEDVALDFGFKTINSEWYVDQVDAAD